MTVTLAATNVVRGDLEQQIVDAGRAVEEVLQRALRLQAEAAERLKGVLEALVIDTVSEYAPNLRRIVLHR